MIFKERNLPIFENDFQTVRSRLVSNLSVSSSSLSTSWTFQFYVFLFGYVSFCPVKRIMILIIYWEICVKEFVFNRNDPNGLICSCLPLVINVCLASGDQMERHPAGIKRVLRHFSSSKVHLETCDRQLQRICYVLPISEHTNNSAYLAELLWVFYGHAFWYTGVEDKAFI